MIYLLLCAYAYVHGQTNAFLYSRKGAEALARNEHRDLTIERGLVAAAVVAACLYSYPLLFVELVAWVLAFSFWHNGAYYVMREKISRGGTISDMGAINAWKHQSPTTTAKLDFTYKLRLWLMLASLAALAVGYGVVFYFTTSISGL
ncbi:hypothetical protein GCM10023188_25770 [Pontibacter saemangeumensis]|uniref:DUF3899 domain-containing protein n=1 Tax=Pontibacter saemangeumensis TaxID=1084525 RepID=A0ABP8LU06_9BACT